jgi:hypothetical protein
MVQSLAAKIPEKTGVRAKLLKYRTREIALFAAQIKGIERNQLFRVL